jgi:ABC-type dipeptide/oligopeptide/nickel transport system permease subunit
VTAAFWTPFDPLKVNLRARLQPPSALYWLGTDEFGRDVLSRIMAGAATSVLVSVLTVTFAVMIGAVIGVITGYLRGWTDRIIMAVNDALLAFPGILLALAVMIVTGANKFGIVLALGIAYIPSVVRVVRGTVLSIREREYIEARASSATPNSIRWRGTFCPTASRPSLSLQPACSAGCCWRRARSASSASACRRRRRPGAICWRRAARIWRAPPGSASRRAFALR